MQNRKQTYLERTLQMWAEDEKQAAERRSSSFGPFLRSLLHILAVRPCAGELTALTVSRHWWCSERDSSRQSTAVWLLGFCNATTGCVGRRVGANEREEGSNIPQVLRPACQPVLTPNTGEVTVYILQRALETLSSTLRDTVRTCAVPKSNSTPLSSEWERF